jgi:hypothetical protein
MSVRKYIGLFIFIALFAVSSCDRNSTSESKQVKVTTEVQKTFSGQVNKPTVERIVFVGKKDACDCTREQIDSTWKALQSVLEGGPEITVKRLQVDVDAEEANRYNAMQPLMALPGVYFLDGKNKITKLLQGELRVDEIAEVLQ